MTRVLYVTLGERMTNGLVSSQVRAVLSHRAAAGDDVTWLAMSPLHRMAEGLKLSKCLGFRCISVPVPVRNLWIGVDQARAFSRVVSSVRNLVGGSWDVVQCRSYPAAWATWSARRHVRAAKFIFDPRGIYPEESMITGPGKARPGFVDEWRRAEKELLDGADTVIAVSERMRTYFGGLSDRALERSVVIPCSGGCGSFDGRATQTGDTSQGLGACYLGSIGSWTGIEDIARSAAFLARATKLRSLTVLGSCDEGALRTGLGKLGASQVRVISRRVAHEGVFDELMQQDVGLLPRTPGLVNEVSWPAKLSEYLVAGLPVVTNLARSNVADVLRAHDALIEEGHAGAVALDAGGILDVERRKHRAMLAARTMSLSAVSDRLGEVWAS